MAPQASPSREHRSELAGEERTEGGEELAEGTRVAGRGRRAGTATRLRTRYLVGCDGGRSTVRKLVGVEFAGEPAATEWLTGEVEITATAQGTYAIPLPR